MYEIEVKNAQTADGETSLSEEKAECTFNLRGGKVYIMYKTAYEGDSVSTSIIISESETVIKRSGYVNSRMIYRAGKETVFPYGTPFGSIPMKLFTTEIKYDFKQSGGIMKLLYTLDMQGDMYYNDMTITVREKL